MTRAELAQCYHEYHHALVTVALARGVGTREDALDIVQEVYLEIIPRARTLRIDTVRPYLSRLIGWRILDKHRARAQQAHMGSPSRPATVDSASSAEIRSDIARAIRHYTTTEQQVLLRSLEGWTTREIAAHYTDRARTQWVRWLRGARKELRDTLHEYFNVREQL